MSTRPSFQFYPGDWTSNPNLRRCTFAEKGVWLEIMCLMHDQPEYGVLRWPLKEIAETVKCKTADLQGLIRKGVLKGDDKQLSEPFIYIPRSGRKDGEPVTLIDTQVGPIWYSSRMVKDEHVRTIRANSSGNGGTPDAAPKPPFGEPMGVGFGPRGSSSSSSPSGNTPATTARAPEPDAEVFPVSEGWRPSAAFAVQAKLMGLSVLGPDAMAEGIAEFTAYWLTRPGELRTQAAWENALAQSLKRRQVKAAEVTARKAVTARPVPSRPPTAAELRVYRSSPGIMDPDARARVEAHLGVKPAESSTVAVGDFIDMEAQHGNAIGMD